MASHGGAHETCHVIPSDGMRYHGKSADAGKAHVLPWASLSMAFPRGIILLAREGP